MFLFFVMKGVGRANRMEGVEGQQLGSEERPLECGERERKREKRV